MINPWTNYPKNQENPGDSLVWRNVVEIRSIAFVPTVNNRVHELTTRRWIKKSRTSSKSNKDWYIHDFANGEIGQKLDQLFHIANGEWRNESHVGIAWFRSEFHFASAQLHEKGAAIRAAALLKLHTQITELAKAGSASRDISVQTILLELQKHANNLEISREKWFMTHSEQEAAKKILAELEKVWGWKIQRRAGGQVFPPMTESILLFRKPAWRCGTVLGRTGKIWEAPSENQLTENFLDSVKSA